MPWICTLNSQSSRMCKHFTCFKHIENVSLLSNLAWTNNVPPGCIIQNKPEIQFHPENLSGSYACSVNTCSETFKSTTFLKIHLKNVHKYREDYLKTFMVGHGANSEGGERFTPHKQRFKTSSNEKGKFYVCEFPSCNERRTKKPSIVEHIKEAHSSSIQNFCIFCHAAFDTNEELDIHKNLVHYKKNEFHEIEESHQDENNPEIFNKGSLVKAFTPNKFVQVDQIFNREVLEETEHLLDSLASHTGSVYIKPSLLVMAGEQNSEGDIINVHQRLIYTPNHFEILANSHDTSSSIMKMREGLQLAAENLENTIGSGFTILSIDGLKFDYNRKRGLRGGSWISSTGLSHKNSTLNIQNKDDRCLLYSIAAHLYPPPPTVSKKVRENPKTYEKHLSAFNIDGISFPVSGKQQVQEFIQKNNHLDFNLTIYKLFGKDVHPIFSSKKQNEDEKKFHIRLLEIEGYIQPSEKNPEPRFTSHYLLITNINSFLRKHYIDRNGKIYNNKKNICPSCNKFSTRDKNTMDKHRKGCDITKSGQEFKTADPGKTLKFSRTKAAFPPPLVGAADFETTVTKSSVCQHCKNLYHHHLSSEQIDMMICYHTQMCSRPECENKKNGCAHKSTLIQKNLNSVAHFGMILDRDLNVFDEKVSFGYNCAETYLQHLLDIEDRVTSYIAKNIPCKPLTAHQKNLYKTQIKCGEYQCHTILDRRRNGEVTNRPVVDHCHLR